METRRGVTREEDRGLVKKVEDTEVLRARIMDEEETQFGVIPTGTDKNLWKKRIAHHVNNPVSKPPPPHGTNGTPGVTPIKIKPVLTPTTIIPLCRHPPKITHVYPWKTIAKTNGIKTSG